MPTKSQQIAQEYDAVAKEIMNLYDQHKTAEEGVFNFTEEQLAEVRTKNDKLGELKKDLDKELETERILANAKAASESVNNLPANQLPFPGVGPQGQQGEAPHSAKTIGDLFIESPAFKEYNPNTHQGPSIDIPYDLQRKATLTETGWPPQAVRIARVESYPVRANVVADLIPQGTTDQIAIVYMEETTFTNAAAETGEGLAKPEASLGFTERSSSVRKIAVLLPVTEELMQDVSGVRAYIDNRLEYMIQQREDTQLINGDGIAPNLLGHLNWTGIQTQAKGADPTVEAIYKAMTLVRTVGFAEPDTVIIHPADWQEVRLLKTTAGEYIWGHPALAGPETVWGVRVVATTACPEGTAEVADLRGFTMIFRKSGITITVSNSHSDYFSKNLLAIRAEERLATVVFRPKAICSVTGI